MRYYFHLHDGSKLNRDPVGLIMNLTDAWSLAYSLVRQTQRDHPRVGASAHVYLADETGTAYIIPFSMAHRTEAAERKLATA